MSTLVSPLQDTDVPGWTLYADGREIPAKMIEIRSKDGRYGHIEVGMREAAPGVRFHGPLYYEPGGGGAVTVLSSTAPEGELLIGLLYENRPNLGGQTLCVIGGMMQPGQSRSDAQRAESEEEGGIDSSAALLLPGLPYVTDRLLWAANPRLGEGIHAFHLPVPFEALEKTVDGGYRFTPEHSADDKKRGLVLFLPWRRAVAASSDAVALAAIVRLLAYLSPLPSF